MEINGKKARVLAFVSAVGLMVIGCQTKTPVDVKAVDVEVEPKQEPADIKKISELTVKLQKKRKLFPPQNGEVLRGVHPKSHGCVDATFTVNKGIGGDYRVGLFKYPGTYRAKIRYSNASVLELRDLEGGNGSRGMAIKVLGVNGPIMLADGGARNQDFLMVNTPEFAFANVRDYLRLTRALMKHPVGADPNPYFIPAKLFGLGLMDIAGNLKPPVDDHPRETEKGGKQLREGLKLFASVFKGFTPEDMTGTLQSIAAVKNINSKTVRNPLEVQYFSASPFRYGPDRVMKFSVAPVDGEKTQPKFSPEEMENVDANYLAKALEKTMAKGESIHLSFKVQVIKASDLKTYGKELIENAAKTWDKKQYPSVEFTTVEVAKIEIKPVNVEKSKKLVDACKSLLFTPWHALAAHEPLGGINRLRKPVYSKSAEHRRNAANAY